MKFGKLTEKTRRALALNSRRLKTCEDLFFATLKNAAKDVAPTINAMSPADKAKAVEELLRQAFPLCVGIEWGGENEGGMSKTTFKANARLFRTVMATGLPRDVAGLAGCGLVMLVTQQVKDERGRLDIDEIRRRLKDVKTLPHAQTSGTYSGTYTRTEGDGRVRVTNPTRGLPYNLPSLGNLIEALKEAGFQLGLEVLLEWFEQPDAKKIIRSTGSIDDSKGMQRHAKNILRILAENKRRTATAA